MGTFICTNCGKEFETTAGSFKRYAGFCFACRKLNITHACSVCGKQCAYLNRTCSKECMLADPQRTKNQREANKRYWEGDGKLLLGFKREVARRSIHTPEARRSARASLIRRWEAATDEDRARHGAAVSKAVMSDPNLPERLRKSILRGEKVSVGQRQVFDYVRGLCADAVLESPLDRYLLDIFIPSKKVAIEFNGWYWHSDRANRSEITLEKYRLCKKLGIRLVVVWDFDWTQKRGIWESKLRSILGGSVGRIGARSCVWRDSFDVGIKRDFLNSNHIQGDDNSFYWSGLFLGDSCVAVMTFRRSRDNRVVELSRYCGDVVGGFSKLLRHSKDVLLGMGIDSVVSFSDNSVSEGDLYSRNGWKKVSDVKSDYRVVHNGKCFHKSSFTKSNIRRRFPEVYSDGLTEFQMEDVIPAYRIWDCGKTKWVFSFS